nr:hypothetical protein [Mycobacterium sp. KBS0706]
MRDEARRGVVQAAVQVEQLGRDHRRHEQDGGWSREQAEARQLDVAGGLERGEALQRRAHRRGVEPIVDAEREMWRDLGPSWRHRVRIGPLDGVDQRCQRGGAGRVEIEVDGERHGASQERLT